MYKNNVVSSVFSNNYNPIYETFIQWEEIKTIVNKNIITFGNSENNIEMLKKIRFGIAMRNITNEAKAIANKTLELIKE